MDIIKYFIAFLSNAVISATCFITFGHHQGMFFGKTTTLYFLS
jgi:hypothetical protein